MACLDSVSVSQLSKCHWKRNHSVVSFSVDYRLVFHSGFWDLQASEPVFKMCSKYRTCSPSLWLSTQPLRAPCWNRHIDRHHNGEEHSCWRKRKQPWEDRWAFQTNVRDGEPRGQCCDVTLGRQAGIWSRWEHAKVRRWEITCSGNESFSNSGNKEVKLQRHLQEEVRITRAWWTTWGSVDFILTAMGNYWSFTWGRFAVQKDRLGSQEVDDGMGGGSPEAVTKRWGT